MSNASTTGLCGVGGYATESLVAQMTYNRECGGFGVCNVAENVCVCDAAGFWVGSSDFIDAAAFDCPTNLIYVYILWAINALEVVVIAIQSQGVIFARMENFFEQRKQNSEYTILKNRGLLAVILQFSLQMPFQLAFAVTKLVNPTRQVGIDPLITSFFFLAKLGFYSGTASYQPALLQSILKGTKGVETILKVNTAIFHFVMSLAASVGALAFISLFLTSLENRILIARSYYIIHSIGLFINGIMAIYVQRIVTRVLDHSASLVADARSIGKTMRLKARLNAVQGTSSKQGILQGIIFLVFFLLPSAWDKHDYILPLSWLAMPVIAKNIAFAINLDGIQNKSLIDRFMKKKEHSTTAGEGVGSQSEMKGSTAGRREGSVIVIGGSMAVSSSYVVAVMNENTGNKNDGQVASLLPVTEEGRESFSHN